MASALVRAASRSASLRISVSKRSARVVRLATTPESNSDVPSAGTVFYGGKAYTLDEWKEAVESGSLARPTAAVAAVTANTENTTSTLTFNDVMSFSGSAPEIVNGRLAMLGIVSALAAEAASGEGVLRQWSEEPTGVAVAFLLFIGGSMVTAFLPASKRAEKKLGPFTPQAELINGRAAM
ncbi:hypothetical protein GPECTOR_125g513 [Gonium pectorale]|uniref:Uncharacterized protein n=1 Tax=Gonium pectorale TaxID=33097 RepID=A0A150G035_GONPE|nr:hypothetical protein GPECTOR_125g513 [Gonium pectorale]|eukprot:KXZ42680.1 hypothetical protein GPECTOR_125g513 [Gonium pectorale]